MLTLAIMHMRISISLLFKKAGHTIHINIRQVKVDLYKFTLSALSAP